MSEGAGDVTELEIWRDMATRDLCFSGRIAEPDLENVCLTDFDKVLLRDCDNSDATAADKLLAFEMLFRRILTDRAKARI